MALCRVCVFVKQSRGTCRSSAPVHSCGRNASRRLAPRRGPEERCPSLDPSRRSQSKPLLGPYSTFDSTTLKGATHKDGGAPPGNSLLPGPPRPAPRPAPGPARPTSTLDDVLTPELVQSYLALQLHRAALDMAERTQASRSAGPRCSDSPCRGATQGAASLRRAKRLAHADAASDVPVVRGLVGTAQQGSRALPSASPFLALRPPKPAPPRDDSNDVPVFKGTHEGTPVVHLVTAPPPAVARIAPAATTVPTVPVVKGSNDPAHPTTPRTLQGLLPGDLQLTLTPEEEEALAVLLEGRNRKGGDRGDKPSRARPAAPRPPSRPANWPSAPRPTGSPALVGSVSSVSGKVGGKASPSLTPTQQGSSSGSSANDKKQGCCSQRRLVQELERQLTLLRQLNAAHMREEWVRASYPSPYYPYLHNLPVHSARGYDDGPMLVPAYYLPSGWRRGDALLPPPSTWTSGSHRPGEQPARADCSGQDDGDADDGGLLDDKVQLGEQQQLRRAGDREADDLRGADPQDDVDVDPKIGQPVDFEVRR